MLDQVFGNGWEWEVHIRTQIRAVDLDSICGPKLGNSKIDPCSARGSAPLVILCCRMPNQFLCICERNPTSQSYMSHGLHYSLVRIIIASWLNYMIVDILAANIIRHGSWRPKHINNTYIREKLHKKDLLWAVCSPMVVRALMQDY